MEAFGGVERSVGVPGTTRSGTGRRNKEKNTSLAERLRTFVKDGWVVYVTESGSKLRASGCNA